MVLETVKTDIISFLKIIILENRFIQIQGLSYHHVVIRNW